MTFPTIILETYYELFCQGLSFIAAFIAYIYYSSVLPDTRYQGNFKNLYRTITHEVDIKKRRS